MLSHKRTAQHQPQRQHKKPRVATVEELCHPPPRWTEVLECVSTMRSTRTAPVDTVGCSAISQQFNMPPKQKRFCVLVSLLLSSQTPDRVTAQGVTNLFNLKGGLTVENINALDESIIDNAIYSVGFHQRKASYLKETARILLEKHNGEVPDNIGDILKLKGIGPKMAHLCLTHAWGKTEGIGVDIHVHRICNRLHWVKTKTPEETRIQLERWLPRSIEEGTFHGKNNLWGTINKLFVGFGQEICKAKPKCSECSLSQQTPEGTILCPYAKGITKKKKAKP